MARTPTALLVALCRSGVDLRLTRDRQRITAPARALTAEVREALDAHRSELLQILALVEDYRELLKKMFSRLTGRRRLGPEECARFVDEQTRFADELGPALRASVFDMVARDWRMTTGICVWCAGQVTCPDSHPHGR
jgi:TubC N-terminal docking domain